MMRITALLPIRNGGRYIVASLPSILQNLSLEDELLIINDGSTDDTEELLNIFSKEDSRIRIIQNHRSGLVNSLNLGIRESSHNWIARFDIDDTYPPDRIFEQRRLILPEVVGIFSDYEFRTEKGETLGHMESAVFNCAVNISLLSSQRTAHPSVLFRRDAAIDSGVYRLDDFPAEDLSLWLRLSRQGSLVSVPKTLLFYQLSGSSVSANSRDRILRKKSELIQEIGVQENNIDDFFQNFTNIFSEYERMSFSSERKILIARELFLYLNSERGPTGLKAKYFKLCSALIRDVRLFPASYKIAKYRHFRNVYRKNLKLEPSAFIQ